MINKNMLKGLEPNTSPNSYFTVITKIEQKEECNQESVVLTLQQIDKDLETISEDASVIEKELTITSGLELSDDDFYRTRLVGYCIDKNKITPVTTAQSSHFMEIAEVTLTKEINLEFNKEYTSIPAVVVNIDEQFLSYYKDYTTSYVMEENKYVGVKITFNKLKSKAIYPDMRVVIIGDIIETEDPEDPAEPEETGGETDANTDDPSDSESE